MALQSVSEINQLGRDYAVLPDGEDKEQKLLALCQAFHGYLMKYLVMICRGHVPIHGAGTLWGHLNKDSQNFLMMFLVKGAPINKDTYLSVVRQFHLAFKGKETAEIYDILIEQLLRAIRKYDPDYNLKLKQIVEMIDDKFAQPKFTLAAANRHLGFDAVGHLRLLIRREYLEAAGKGEYERTAAWPPAVRLFSKPIGITNCIQTWFRYYLEQWIPSSMRQLETKEGVYSLDYRGEYGDGSSHASSGNTDLAIPASSRRAGTEGGTRTRCFLRRRPERFEIAGGRLRDAIEFHQQIGYINEADAQRTTIQRHARGKQGSVMHWLHRNDDAGARARAAELLERLHQALTPSLFDSKLRAGLEWHQLLDQ